MCYTWKNGSHLKYVLEFEKWVTGKKCVTGRKIGNTEKMFHTWKSHTKKTVLQLEKWVRLKKDVSLFKKLVAIKKCVT